MAHIRIFLLSLFLVGLNFQVYAQSTIWEENFESYNTSTTTSPKWSINTNLKGTCSVVQDPTNSTNKLLEATDVSNSATWTTESIDISGKSQISVTIDLMERGQLESTGLYMDYIRCEYQVDNGIWTTFSTNGYLAGNFTSAIAQAKGISGTTLKLRVTMHNTATNEYHYIDNIIVQVPGKLVWLKADAGASLSGQQVYSWKDQSGNGNDADQTTSTNQPTYNDNLINFNPALEFVETLTSSNYLSIKNKTSINPSEFSVFSVFEPGNNTGPFDAIISKQLYNNSGYSLQYYPNQNSLITVLNPEFTNHYVYSDRSSSISTTGNPQILGGLYDGTQITTFSNNVENFFTYSNPIMPNNYDLLVGKDYSGSYPDFLDGNLCEIIMYNEALSQTEQNEVKSYLALKYGITLTTDNYYNSSGTLIYDRSTYGNNIAGLGYDSNFNLNQKVSSSVNTNNTQSSDITIATTADFTSSNQATGRTPLTDGQYLIWGDDNGQTTSWVTDGSYKRVGRWWKIQNTGTVGQVNIQINLGNYPAPASSVYTLIVDNDANLSDGGLKDGIVLTAGANNLYTATVTFPAGITYFTIADIPQLSLTASITNTIKCNGGTDGAISASATGGIGNYIFYLNNTQTTFPISTLSAGTYDVKVTSGSESQSQTLTLTEPGKMMNTHPDITNIKCKGDNTGAIDIHIPYPIQFSSSTKDYINLGSSLLNNLSSFTMEGWIKFNKNDLAGLGRVGLFGQNDIIEFGFINSTTLYIWTANGGSCSVNLSNYPSDNDWHHIAVVGTANQLIIYIDGAQQGISTHTSISTYGTSSYPVTMGGYVYDAIGASNSNSFPGEIRKVGFWSRALSQTEIQNIANTNTDYSGSESNLIAGYNFFEGAGNSVAPVGTVTTKGTFGNSTTWDTNPYSFQWSKAGTAFATTEDVNGISAGDYSLTINNSNGCSQTEIYTVTEPSTPFVVTLTATPSVHDACVGTQISLSSSVTGGTSPYNDDFMIGASTVQSGTQTTYDYNTISGTQNITVKTIDANGCATTSSGYTVTGSNTPTTGVIVKN